MLVVVSWSFTESINEGIEPTSGPLPKPSSSSSSPECSAPTPLADAEPDAIASADAEPDAIASADAEPDAIASADAEPDFVATAVVCKTSD
ncbi:hypothetical protein [Streptomyces chromofuscus]|uniref:Uncharacterized protein n=1 Tax=Streptomyces chromofuscus TaxID=42881 RepID=A0A7M2TJC3_STRCW|nr:hypothetical protein [Streptomyces chromofuscus]QOV47371.1 hypothetical protein IPT68_16720 [Streptomyces chromofuscus]GGT25413.1 hypothetical protein GCM10010254_52480 [Streptomyces chromofuscus]